MLKKSLHSGITGDRMLGQKSEVLISKTAFVINIQNNDVHLRLGQFDTWISSSALELIYENNL